MDAATTALIDGLFIGASVSWNRVDWDKSDGAWFRRYQRKRADGIYECLWVYPEWLGSELVIDVQMVAHFFEECPIPAGPFGRDGNVVDIVSDHEVMIAPEFLSVDRFRVSTKTDARLSEQLRPVFRVITQTFDTWANELLQDNILQTAAGHGVPSAHIIPKDELVKVLRELGTETLRGYPIGKVAAQACRRAAQGRNWHHI